MEPPLSTSFYRCELNPHLLTRDTPSRKVARPDRLSSVPNDRKTREQSTLVTSSTRPFYEQPLVEPQFMQR
jgi:hypothetical protein